jgi:hypothetical protein
VAITPETHLREGTPIVETFTVAVANLFNSAYDTLLLMLRHFFTHRKETVMYGYTTQDEKE